MIKLNKSFYIILGEYDIVINTKSIREYCKRYGIPIKQLDYVSHMPMIECSILPESIMEDFIT